MGNCHPQCAGCPTHPQHRQRPATPHTACGVSQLLPPFEPHPQRLLPQQQDDSAGGKILQPTLVNVGWSGEDVGGKGKGGGGFLSRRGRGESIKCTYTNTCVQLCTSILHYVLHAIYNESMFRRGKRRCLEPAFPPLRPLHPPKTLPQL